MVLCIVCGLDWLFSLCFHEVRCGIAHKKPDPLGAELDRFNCLYRSKVCSLQTSQLTGTLIHVREMGYLSLLLILMILGRTPLLRTARAFCTDAWLRLLRI